MDYAVVALIGGLVGLAELMARYRDAPFRAVQTPAAGLYLGLNVAACVAALVIIEALDWRFGVEGNDEALEWTRILVAGFGAMALFRSSLFIVRIGDEDVGVGPSGFLQVVLDAADRAVDRRRAGARVDEVSVAMRDVSFARAAEALPTYCLALMQNATEEEKVSLGNQVSLLRLSNMEDRVKALALGLALMNVVGSETLQAAVTSLHDEIRVETVSDY